MLFCLLLCYLEYHWQEKERKKERKNERESVDLMMKSYTDKRRCVHQGGREEAKGKGGGVRLFHLIIGIELMVGGWFGPLEIVGC